MSSNFMFALTFEIVIQCSVYTNSPFDENKYLKTEILTLTEP